MKSIDWHNSTCCIMFSLNQWWCFGDPIWNDAFLWKSNFFNEFMHVKMTIFHYYDNKQTFFWSLAGNITKYVFKLKGQQSRQNQEMLKYCSTFWLMWLHLHLISVQLMETQSFFFSSPKFLHWHRILKVEL